MSCLRKPTLFDTVSTAQPITRRWIFYRMTCPHAHQTSYVRVDRRAGPGSFADNFEGQVCVDCGEVTFERQTL